MSFIYLSEIIMADDKRKPDADVKPKDKVAETKSMLKDPHETLGYELFPTRDSSSDG